MRSREAEVARAASAAAAPPCLPSVLRPFDARLAAYGIVLPKSAPSVAAGAAAAAASVSLPPPPPEDPRFVPAGEMGAAAAESRRAAWMALQGVFSWPAVAVPSAQTQPQRLSDAAAPVTATLSAAGASPEGDSAGLVSRARLAALLQLEAGAAVLPPRRLPPPASSSGTAPQRSGGGDGGASRRRPGGGGGDGGASGSRGGARRPGAGTATIASSDRSGGGRQRRRRPDCGRAESAAACAALQQRGGRRQQGGLRAGDRRPQSGVVSSRTTHFKLHRG